MALLSVPGWAETVDNVDTEEKLNAAIAEDGNIINVTKDIVLTNPLTIQNSVTLHGNGHTLSRNLPTAKNGGEVIAVNAGGKTVTIDGFTITGGNIATNPGGGMVVNPYCTVNVTNCTFTGNTATSAGGMLIYANATANVIHCTFAGNKATVTYGGVDEVYCESGTFNAVNTIFWNESTSPHIDCSMSEAQVNLYNCAYVEGKLGDKVPSPTNGVTLSDWPGNRWDAAYNVFKLEGTDTLIDKGAAKDNTNLPVELRNLIPDVDQLGAPRTGKVNNDEPDIGAIEYVQTVTVNTDSLANGKVSEDYTASLEATPGGCRWSLTGSLPGGLSLNAATGAITGKPTATGESKFKVKAICGAYPSTEKELTLTVNKGASAITKTPAAKTGLVYTGAAQDLITAGTATGGTLKYKVDGGEYGEGIPKGTDAKTYIVYWYVEGNDNYEGMAEKSFEVIINPKSSEETGDGGKDNPGDGKDKDDSDKGSKDNKDSNNGGSDNPGGDEPEKPASEKAAESLTSRLDPSSETVSNLITSLFGNGVKIITLSTDVATLSGDRSPADLSSGQLGEVSSDHSVILAVLPEITPKVTAVFVLGVSFDITPEGTLKWHGFPKNAKNGVALAADEEKCLFLNDKGEEITTAPANGHLNVAVKLTKDVTYAPVITAETSTAPTGPTSDKDGGGCDAGLGLLALAALPLVLRKRW